MKCYRKEDHIQRIMKSRNKYGRPNHFLSWKKSTFRIRRLMRGNAFVAVVAAAADGAAPVVELDVEQQLVEQLVVGVEVDVVAVAAAVVVVEVEKDQPGVNHTVTSNTTAKKGLGKAKWYRCTWTNSTFQCTSIQERTSSLRECYRTLTSCRSHLRNPMMPLDSYSM